VADGSVAHVGQIKLILPTLRKPVSP
jgi:hypothetical protein